MRSPQISTAIAIAVSCGALAPLPLSTKAYAAGAMEPRRVCSAQAFTYLRSLAASRGLAIILDNPASGVMVLSQAERIGSKRVYFQIIVQRVQRSHNEFATVYTTQLTGEPPPTESDSITKEIDGQLRASFDGRCG